MVATMAGVPQLQKRLVDYTASLFQEVSVCYIHIYFRYIQVVFEGVCFENWVLMMSACCSV